MSLKVGQTGNLSTEWMVQNSRRNQIERLYGSDIDFHSNLIMNGIDDDVVLNVIESQIKESFTEDNHTLLDWNKSLWNNSTPDDRVFQDSDQKLYTNVDLEKGQFEVMDEQTFTEKLGMDWEGGKPYDLFEIENNHINFYEFNFAGLEDGEQDSVKFSLNELQSARWGINDYTIREVDKNLWNVPEDSEDAQSTLAYDTLRLIEQAIPQWMTNEIAAQLADFEPDSKEYRAKFIELASKLMDQEGYLSGNDISSPSEEEPTAPVQPQKPVIGVSGPTFEEYSVTDEEGIVWKGITNVSGGSMTAQLENGIKLTRTSGTMIPYYTAVDKNGVTKTFSGDDVKNSGLTLRAYIDKLYADSAEEPSSPYIEIGGGYTTKALGEEGGNDYTLTTNAVGEEGGNDYTATTKSIGEEGGQISTPVISVTPPFLDFGGGQDDFTLTTYAVGEEGGNDFTATTKSIGEEGGNDLTATTKSIGEEGGI